jgi:geranylgeranyl reductase family protein
LSYDIIVGGAGPTGSIVAEAVAKEGYKVLMLEEHTEIGLPEHCTGKMSINALEALKLKPRSILQRVKGATCFAPNMKSFTVRRNSFQANILDRYKFDKDLALKATKAGVLLFTEARVTNVSIDSKGVNVIFNLEGEKKRVVSRVVVGADGIKSTVARKLGIYSKKPVETKIAAQRKMVGVFDLDQDMVEMFFSNKYAPGFFAWVVPIAKDGAKVGLCVSPSSGKPAMKFLDEFIKTHPFVSERLRDCSSLEQTAHLIPTGGPIKKDVSDGVLIVGDAAGQVKSTTGGGLYYGILCAKIAGEVICRALSKREKRSVISETVLTEYRNRWWKILGREIEFSVKARQFIDLLSDDDINYLFKVLKSNEALISLIEAEGDIDQQSRIASLLLKNLKPLIMNPKLLYKMSKVFIK